MKKQAIGTPEKIFVPDFIGRELQDRIDTDLRERRPKAIPVSVKDMTLAEEVRIGTQITL